MKGYSATERQAIAQGLCRMCRQPRGERGTRIHCRPCADVHRDRAKARHSKHYQGRVLNGLCLDCGQPATKGQRCEEHAARSLGYTRSRRANRRRAGICTECDAPTLDTVGTCLEHWARARTRLHFGSEDRWEFLIELAEAQEWRCHYTGAALVPGGNMSLDHKVARAHPNYPGDQDFTNLAWTTKAINLAKNKLSDSDFIELCRAVVAHHDARASGLDVEAGVTRPTKRQPEEQRHA